MQTPSNPWLGVKRNIILHRAEFPACLTELRDCCDLFPLPIFFKPGRTSKCRTYNPAIGVGVAEKGVGDFMVIGTTFRLLLRIGFHYCPVAA